MADLPDKPTAEDRWRAAHDDLERTFLDRASALTDAILGSFDRMTEEDWDRFTKKAPDRQMQGLTQAAKLAGLSQPERLQIHADLVVSPKAIRELPDMELERRIAALEAKTVLALPRAEGAARSSTEGAP